MNLESLQEMKYSELLKMAIKLQIELPQSKKKDVLIQLLIDYQNKNSQTELEEENKENQESVPKKKVKKVKKIVKVKKSKKTELENEKEENSENDANNRTMTRSRANAPKIQTLNKTTQDNEAEQDDKSVQNKDEEFIIETKYEIREDGKKVKKIKKIKKKTTVKTQVREEEPVEESEKIIKEEIKTKKKNKKSEKQEVEDKKIVDENIIEKTEKKTKKSSKATKLTKPDDVEIMTPKSTRSTRSRKFVNNSDETIEQNTIKIVQESMKKNDTELDAEKEANDERDCIGECDINETISRRIEQDCEARPAETEDKPIENEKDFEPNVKIAELSDDQIEQSDFKLTLEEDTNDEKKNIENTEHVELEPVDCSLMTNDEEKSSTEVGQNDDPEITRDIMNTTFDKKEDGLSCGTFYSKKIEEPIEHELKNEEEQAKPKTGGARIVRPKQTVTLIQTSKTAKNETIVEEVKKVVEVINREAGPRIVKPVSASDEIIVEPKRKINIDQNNKVKKVKENEQSKAIVPRKVPDFKAIHEKESQKMESIDSYANRKQERFNKLNDKSPCVQNEKASKLKTPTIVSKIQSVIKPKTPSGPSTPKLVKNFTGTLLSNIPKISKREEKHEDEQKLQDPKTPECTLSKNSKLLKTPSSVTKPTESFLLKSNIKRNPSLKDSNGASQLQTSSFVRRKSFDLNASLARPLNYKPHQGHLKKVDFSAKSVFLASLATTNLNETKCGDKSILKQNDSILNADANKRRISLISKVRSDNAGTCTDRNALADYIKSDKIKQITDKSTMVAKKLRMEKAKAFKQSKSDQNRQLENCENEQEA